MDWIKLGRNVKYKINRLTLVNTRVFEEYLELFRV